MISTRQNALELLPDSEFLRIFIKQREEESKNPMGTYARRDGIAATIELSEVLIHSSGYWRDISFAICVITPFGYRFFCECDPIKLNNLLKNHKE